MKLLFEYNTGQCYSHRSSPLYQETRMEPQGIWFIYTLLRLTSITVIFIMVFSASSLICIIWSAAIF